jgi:hypothetical protein
VPTDAGKFFDLIHSPAGWRCLFVLPERRHFWFPTSDTLLRVATALDARGKAVFHACATFTEKKRKQENVHQIRCFWLDIDAGAGKPYVDAREAYRALEGWRAKASLPPALIVVSGGGLHAYWPLRDPLGIVEWQHGAARLRALAAEHGLAIDPGSTIDAARILRPPGTHNRKLLDANGKKLAETGGTERPVICGPLVGPYSREDLSVLFSSESPTAGAFGTEAVPSFLKGVADPVGMTAVGASEQPADPAQVAARCPQFKQLLEAVGKKEDPAIGWYPYMGVFAFCGAAGHEYARNLATDPQWVPTINAKLAQWQEKTSGPTTCAHFSSLNAGPCILCPHAGKITSPIQLGRDLPPSVTAPSPPKLDLPRLPKGFCWKGQRLAADRKPTDDDSSDHHIISEFPIVIDELQETERSKKVSLVYRSWEPMAQAWRDFAMDMGEVVGQGGPARLANQGVMIPKRRWDQFVLYTQNCANEHRGSKHYGIRYEQFGWKNHSFVLGQCLLRSNAAPIRIHGNEEIARRGALMAPVGTQSAWSAAANQLLGREGMEAHAFMLLAAFAAPLYYFTGEAGMTFVHGVTRASGQGKSTMLEIGASVYGQPTATSIIERDTLVAKFMTLGTLCNLPVFFDELRFRDPDDTKAYVLQGTIGRDKQRGKAEGGLRTDHLHWSTIHISASNLSLTDTVRHDGNEVAQAARIFEFSLSLPAGTKTTDGDALKTVLRANAGTAGRVFVQGVLDAYAWVEQAVLARMAYYEKVLEAGPDERFVLRLLACVDVAGALCKRHGLLAVDLDKVMRWAVGVQKGNAGRLAVESAVDAGAVVSQMVNDLVPTMLVMPRGQTVGKPGTVPAIREPKNELKARLEIDSRKLLVDIVAVRKWMQVHQYSFSEIQKELKGMGVLKEERVRRTLGAGTPLGLGQTWCWQIDGQHALLADLIDMVVAPTNVLPFKVAP